MNCAKDSKKRVRTRLSAGGKRIRTLGPPRRDPDRPLSTSFFFAYLATVRIPLRCPTRPVGNRLRVCLDGGKAARKGPRIPLPRQRVSLSGPEASIFDLPNIACGMLFSVNMWADEFSAPNLVKAVPAADAFAMTRLRAPSWMRPSAGTPLIDAIVCDPTGRKRPGG